MQKKNLIKIKNIKGIGNTSVTDVCSLFGLNLRKKFQLNLPYNGILRIKKFLRIKKTTTVLQTIIKKRINNHILIRTYKGMRHKNAYPVRGQRTHTNGKTQKKLATIR